MLKCHFSRYAADLMTRKDSEKDSERPHYYSQFWLDVAAGRRVIGAPRPGEEEASDLELPDVTPPRRVGRVSTQEPLDEPYARHLENHTHEAASVATEEAYPELEEEAFDEEEQDLQDSTVEDIDVPDMDLGLEEEEEEDDFFEEELEEDEEEEEEEDIGWGGRGRKKAKPGRQVKPPKKPTKRDRRSGY